MVNWNTDPDAAESMEVDVYPWPWTSAGVMPNEDGTWSAWLSGSIFDDTDDLADLGRYRTKQNAKDMVEEVVEELPGEPCGLFGSDDFDASVGLSRNVVFHYAKIEKPEAVETVTQ